MFLQQIVNGVMLGSTFSLVAIGYTLIFGVLNLLHFAHGEVFMLGAFFALQLTVALKWGILPSLIGAMAGTALVDFLNERVAIRLPFLSDALFSTRTHTAYGRLRSGRSRGTRHPPYTG